MLDIEKVSYEVFKNNALDKIMKKNSYLKESEAETIYKNIEMNIDVFSQECLVNNDYFSVRYAIMNRIKEI